MTAEHGDSHSEQEYPAIEIHLTADAGEGQPQAPLSFKIIPDTDIGTAVNRDEGGYTVFTRGRIISGEHEVSGEVAITIYPPVTESSVGDDMTHRNTSIPESPPEAVTGQTSAPTEQSEREDGNELFEFTGNPAFEPIYRTWTDRKTGQQRRKAIFELATNPTEDDPGYRRITAFDGLATYVKKNVHVGQTDVEVTGYGPKHWKEGKKEVTGYYAQKVKVPKRYRQG